MGAEPSFIKIFSPKKNTFSSSKTSPEGVERKTERDRGQISFPLHDILYDVSMLNVCWIKHFTKLSPVSVKFDLNKKYCY
jgi:hypothetical protein